MQELQDVEFYIMAKLLFWQISILNINVVDFVYSLYSLDKSILDVKYKLRWLINYNSSVPSVPSITSCKVNWSKNLFYYIHVEYTY